MVDIPEMGKAQMASQAGGPSAEHIRGVFEDYCRLFSTGQTDAIAALYAEDAVVRDPVTSPPVVGRDAISAWYQSAFDAMESDMLMELDGGVRIAGHLAAAAMIVRYTNNGVPFRVETLDVMQFNAEGLITAMDAYFGPSNYHAA